MKKDPTQQEVLCAYYELVGEMPIIVNFRIIRIDEYTVSACWEEPLHQVDAKFLREAERLVPLHRDRRSIKSN